MENKFKYSNTNKRYHTFDYYLKNKYGCKVFKVALDGGFTCPNRDGKVSTGGCIFCSELGSGEFTGGRGLDLDFQFEKQKEIMHNKWPVAKYIAYFQSYTNTYASVEYLKNCFERFVNKEGVVAIALGTRPDCLPMDVLDYLEELNTRIPVVVELGLQTVHDDTALFINRGYPFIVFDKAVKQLNKKNIPVVVHLINGLPNETKEMMIESAKKISMYKLHGVKIHSLCLLKNTKLAKIYVDSPFHILEKDEYIEIMKEQIRYFAPEVIIERITGDAKRSDLIAPLWGLKKTVIANDLDKLMLKEDVYQGDKYLSNAVTYSHDQILNIKNKKVAIDATCGNGHDTLFLKDYFDKVYAFDIQELAIKRCKKKFIDINNITLIHDNFININKHVSESVDCILYNLGFLPGSDHKVKTNYQEVIESLNNVYPLLNKSGKIIIVSYTKHDEGYEFEHIKNELDKLNYQYSLTIHNDERIFIISKD